MTPNYVNVTRQYLDEQLTTYLQSFSSDRIFFLGFSQGGEVIVDYCLNASHVWGGFVSIGGIPKFPPENPISCTEGICTLGTKDSQLSTLGIFLNYLKRFSLEKKIIVKFIEGKGHDMPKNSVTVLKIMIRLKCN